MIYIYWSTSSDYMQQIKRFLSLSSSFTTLSNIYVLPFIEHRICGYTLSLTILLSRLFGCGFPFPAKLEGCRVLDLGSGSGRHCYAFSKHVGQSRHVTGIDMIEELVIKRYTESLSVWHLDVLSAYHIFLQISGSREYIEYHQKKIGYREPNVTFVQGYMKKLSEAGINSNSIDVVLYV